MDWDTFFENETYRTIECVTLFLGVPSLLVLGEFSFSPIPLLIAVSLYALFVLSYRHDYQLERIANFEPSYDNLSSVFMIFLPSAFLFMVGFYYLMPDRAFEFVSQRPLVWAGVMLIYPVFSVLPQEFLFRTFFFERYGNLFASPKLMLFTSAAAFSYSHLIFQNLVAPLLSLPAGYLFAWRYQKSRSFYLVFIEHTLYGWFVFTVGLGSYFWHGAI